MNRKTFVRQLLEGLSTAKDPNRFREVEFNQTASLFDENKPVAVIRPSDDVLGDVQTDNRLLRATRRQINYFAVNSAGDIYLAVWPKILKYTADGILLWSVDAPEGFAGALAVDEGGQLYITSKAGIALYSQSAGSRLIVPAEKLRSGIRIWNERVRALDDYSAMTRTISPTTVPTAFLIPSKDGLKRMISFIFP